MIAASQEQQRPEEQEPKSQESTEDFQLGFLSQQRPEEQEPKSQESTEDFQLSFLSQLSQGTVFSQLENDLAFCSQPSVVLGEDRGCLSHSDQTVQEENLSQQDTKPLETFSQLSQLSQPLQGKPHGTLSQLGQLSQPLQGKPHGTFSQLQPSNVYQQEKVAYNGRTSIGDARGRVISGLKCKENAFLEDGLLLSQWLCELYTPEAVFKMPIEVRCNNQVKKGPPIQFEPVITDEARAEIQLVALGASKLFKKTKVRHDNLAKRMEEELRTVYVLVNLIRSLFQSAFSIIVEIWDCIAFVRLMGLNQENLGDRGDSAGCTTVTNSTCHVLILKLVLGHILKAKFPWFQEYLRMIWTNRYCGSHVKFLTTVTSAFVSFLGERPPLLTGIFTEVSEYLRRCGRKGTMNVTESQVWSTEKGYQSRVDVSHPWAFFHTTIMAMGVAMCMKDTRLDKIALEALQPSLEQFKSHLTTRRELLSEKVRKRRRLQEAAPKNPTEPEPGNDLQVGKKEEDLDRDGRVTDIKEDREDKEYLKLDQSETGRKSDSESEPSNYDLGDQVTDQKEDGQVGREDENKESDSDSDLVPSFHTLSESESEPETGSQLEAKSESRLPTGDTVKEGVVSAIGTLKRVLAIVEGLPGDKGKRARVETLKALSHTQRLLNEVKCIDVFGSRNAANEHDAIPVGELLDSPPEVRDELGVLVPKRGSYHCISNGKWLVSDVIDWWMRRQNALEALDSSSTGRPKKSHCLGPFFATALQKASNFQDYLKGQQVELKLNYNEMRKFSAGSKAQASGDTLGELFDYECLVIPINVQNYHWITALAFPFKRQVRVLDSYTKRSKRLGHKDRIPYGHLILKYLRADYSNRNLEVERSAPFGDWTVVQDETTPQQENDFDCGVFTCMVGEFSRTRGSMEYGQAEATKYRKAMATKMAEYSGMVE